jgi:tetratricopeptide (TPR) repeat protein
MLRAWLQRQRGMLPEARVNMTQSIAMLHQADKVRTLSHAYRLLGLIYDSSNNPPEAIKAYNQARQLSKALDDDFMDSWIVGNMGLIYWSSGQLDQAEKAFAISSRWARTHHAFRQEVFETGNRGLVALSQGRLIGADRLLREHKKQAEQFEVEDEIWRATGNLGIACYHRGHYDEALTLLTSENHYNVLSQASIWGRVSTYINLARLYAAIGDIATGLNWAQMTMVEAEAHPDNNRLRLVCLRGLADVYSQEAYRIGQIEGIPIASPPRDKAIACLKDAVRLSKWRALDRAACFLSLAGLTEHVGQRQHFWNRGVALLDRCGALSWLHYSIDQVPISPNNPPHLAIFF